MLASQNAEVSLLFLRKHVAGQKISLSISMVSSQEILFGVKLSLKGWFIKKYKFRHPLHTLSSSKSPHTWTQKDKFFFLSAFFYARTGTFKLQKWDKIRPHDLLNHIIDLHKEHADLSIHLLKIFPSVIAVKSHLLCIYIIMWQNKVISQIWICRNAKCFRATILN